MDEWTCQKFIQLEEKLSEIEKKLNFLMEHFNPGGWDKFLKQLEGDKLNNKTGINTTRCTCGTNLSSCELHNKGSAYD